MITIHGGRNITVRLIVMGNMVYTQTASLSHIVRLSIFFVSESGCTFLSRTELSSQDSANCNTLCCIILLIDENIFD